MPDTATPFAEEFRAFALAEIVAPPPRDAVLFYGSSSIRLWNTLEQDFPEFPVVNRGFGGSTLADCVQEMDELIFPCRPRVVVLYAGDNDLDEGASPETVLRLFQDFERRLRARLAAVPLAFLSIKPSPLRERNLPNIRRTNELIRAHIAARIDTRFLDIFPQMLNGAGRVRRELFTEDGLHMNRAGYQLWSPVVRDYLVSLGIPR